MMVKAIFIMIIKKLILLDILIPVGQSLTGKIWKIQTGNIQD